MAASTTPAEVITPPVEDSAISEPLSGAVVDRFLAHSGHQEDVVVDPEGHQEHEREQREARIGVREALVDLEDGARVNTSVNSSVEIPSAAPKDSTTVAISSSGEISARNSSIRIRNTTTSDHRDDHLVVAFGGGLVSSQNAEPPPTKASAPLDVVDRVSGFSTMSNAAVDETSAPIVASK